MTPSTLSVNITGPGSNVLTLQDVDRILHENEEKLVRLGGGGGGSTSKILLCKSTTGIKVLIIKQYST